MNINDLEIKPLKGPKVRIFLGKASPNIPLESLPELNPASYLLLPGARPGLTYGKSIDPKIHAAVEKAVVELSK